MTSVFIQNTHEFCLSCSSAGHKEEDVESRRWARLRYQTLKKRDFLRNVLEEQQHTEDGKTHEKVGK